MAVIWQPALNEKAARWQALAARLTREHFAPLAAELDRERRYPSENMRRLVEHKLAGLFIPSAYGGQGAGLTATAAVVEAIGSGCASTATIVEVRRGEVLVETATGSTVVSLGGAIRVGTSIPSTHAKTRC